MPREIAGIVHVLRSASLAQATLFRKSAAMAREPRTQEELRAALLHQRLAIEKSSAAYDAGETWEALRLAPPIYNLVYDHKRTKSILDQLGVKTSIRFISSSAGIEPTNLVASTPLVMFRVGGNDGGAYPKLDLGPPMELREVPFIVWWERDPIFRSGKEKPYWFRRDLVRSIRDQDGGAHFDEELTDAVYTDLKAGAGWMMGDDETSTPLEGLETACMRQVAWELLETLDKAGL